MVTQLYLLITMSFNGFTIHAAIISLVHSETTLNPHSIFAKCTYISLKEYKEQLLPASLELTSSWQHQYLCIGLSFSATANSPTRGCGAH